MNDAALSRAAAAMMYERWHAGGAASVKRVNHVHSAAGLRHGALRTDGRPLLLAILNLTIYVEFCP
jgi:hypothetical protein